MPEVPNCALAQFDTNETATKRMANSAAGPSSSGFPPVRCNSSAGAFASGAGFAKRYCSAQTIRPANDRPQSQGASSHASARLKNATIARIRRYMMAVAIVMPACGATLLVVLGFSRRHVALRQSARVRWGADDEEGEPSLTRRDRRHRRHRLVWQQRQDDAGQ